MQPARQAKEPKQAKQAKEMAAPQAAEAAYGDPDDDATDAAELFGKAGQKVLSADAQQTGKCQQAAGGGGVVNAGLLAADKGVCLAMLSMHPEGHIGASPTGVEQHTVGTAARIQPPPFLPLLLVQAQSRSLMSSDSRRAASGRRRANWQARATASSPSLRRQAPWRCKHCCSLP